jgi:hypothetical protein
MGCPSYGPEKNGVARRTRAWGIGESTPLRDEGPDVREGALDARAMPGVRDVREGAARALGQVRRGGGGGLAFGANFGEISVMGARRTDRVARTSLARDDHWNRVGSHG